MSRYKVIAGQNIYDVALHVYGSIEGVTDLMANNGELSLADDLKAGDELVYTDDYQINKEVVAYYQTHGITPATGEHHVYPKVFSLPLTVEVYVSPAGISAGFSLSGRGKIEVDWGDNSPAECITLEDKAITVNHFFDCPTGGKRKILLYMEGYFKSLDFTDLNAISLYILNPLEVERFTLINGVLDIAGLPMLTSTFYVCLDGLKTEALTPLLALRALMHLSLCGTAYPQSTLDAYLKGLVTRHDNRRSCKVMLESQPSGIYREPDKDADGRYAILSGMEAIWVLTHEDGWNEGSPWEFVINHTVYKYEQND